MTRSLLVAAVCGLLAAPGALADSGKSGHVPPPSKSDGLAYQPIDGIEQFASNLTTAGDQLTGGWYDPKICVKGYCVFSNPWISNGRGMALVTSPENMQKVKRLQEHYKNPDHNRWTPRSSKAPPFYEEEIPGEGYRYVANETIKRGDELMSWTPVLIVHKRFFHDVANEDQATLLASAVQLLPQDTREKFKRQVHTANAAKTNTLREVVERHSFESALGYKFSAGETTMETHFVNYPEVSALRHSCRPSAAFYIDNLHVHRTTAARKMAPGDEVTLTYIDPFQTRAERQKSLIKWRGFGCTCKHCLGNGMLDNLGKSDANILEIKRIEKSLKDHDSTDVTTEMIGRLVELYKEEGLQARMSDAYELVALNYNNLGYPKRAIKYANLGAQAAVVERGRDANDGIALRILAKDPEGHYSYRARIKKNPKLAQAGSK
jgi:hypothetical protein